MTSALLGHIFKERLTGGEFKDAHTSAISTELAILNEMLGSTNMVTSRKEFRPSISTIKDSQGTISGYFVTLFAYKRDDGTGFGYKFTFPPASIPSEAGAFKSIMKYEF